MRREALHLREFPQCRQCFLERGAIVFHEAGSPLKLVHRQPSERTACSSSWQRMTWAGNVIAQYRRSPESEKDRPSTADLTAHLRTIARHDFAMLRREPIRQLHSIRQGFHFDEPAIVIQRAPNELASGHPFNLPPDFLLHDFQ